MQRDVKTARFENTDKFIIHMIMFLSLIFHPWIYLFKMKTLRELVMCHICIKKVRIPHQSTFTRHTEISTKPEVIELEAKTPAN
jgi:hypothetical protein